MKKRAPTKSGTASSNTAMSRRRFKDAAHVVNIDRLHFHRFSSTPLENNVIIGQWDPKDERIYYWCNNSFPSFAIQFLSAHLNVHIDRIRVQTFDIGGSFGIKITSYPQMAVCALASKKAGGRPVKWVETRSEHMVSSAHGNERTFRDTRVALDKNGVITAIDSRHYRRLRSLPSLRAARAASSGRRCFRASTASRTRASISRRR